MNIQNFPLFPSYPAPNEGGTSAPPEFRTAGLTLAPEHSGRDYVFDITDGNLTVTVPNAATLGEGFKVGIYVVDRAPSYFFRTLLLDGLTPDDGEGTVAPYNLSKGMSAVILSDGSSRSVAINPVAPVPYQSANVPGSLGTGVGGLVQTSSFILHDFKGGLDANGLTLARPSTVRWMDGLTYDTLGCIDAAGFGDPNGDPGEGATYPDGLEAKKGSTYRRRDGGAGTCFYVKETEGGPTGWMPK